MRLADLKTGMTVIARKCLSGEDKWSEWTETTIFVARREKPLMIGGRNPNVGDIITLAFDSFPDVGEFGGESYNGNGEFNGENHVQVMELN